MLSARGAGARVTAGRIGQSRGTERIGATLAAGAGLGLRGMRGVGRGIGRAVGPGMDAFDRGYGWLEGRYPRWLTAALRQPGRVLGAALVVVLATGLLLPRLGLELIPEMKQGELVIELEASPGTSLTRMESYAQRAEQIALGVEGVREVFTTVGMGGVGSAIAGGSGDIERHAATLLVRLEGLDVPEPAVREALANGLRDMPGAAFQIDRPRLFTMSSPIEVEVRGYNLQQLSAISEEVRARLRAMPEVAGVEEPRREGNPEVTIQFDRERAARVGLTVGQAAEAVRARVRGLDATELTERDRDIGILVRAREEQRTTLQDLGDLRIETPTGTVSLDAIARLGFGEGPAEIVRRNGSRVVLVQATPVGRDLAGVLTEIEEELRTIDAPPEMSLVVAGQSRELQSSIRSMQMALLLAVFLVYLVMASQFESFRQPMVIMTSVPLALVGAVISLWITRTPVSVVALIGVVMLAGIVVNNAIVLLDTVNQLRRDDGLELGDALREAGRLRLRPILISTLTTVLGLLPLALIRGEGAELRAPLAIPVIGGLLVATLLTLVVVPVLYYVVEGWTLRRAESRATATVPLPDTVPTEG